MTLPATAHWKLRMEARAVYRSLSNLGKANESFGHKFNRKCWTQRHGESNDRLRKRKAEAKRDTVNRMYSQPVPKLPREHSMTSARSAHRKRRVKPTSLHSERPRSNDQRMPQPHVLVEARRCYNTVFNQKFSTPRRGKKRAARVQISECKRSQNFGGIIN
jgi:hypothetical protein